MHIRVLTAVTIDTAGHEFGVLLELRPNWWERLVLGRRTAVTGGTLVLYCMGTPHHVLSAPYLAGQAQVARVIRDVYVLLTQGPASEGVTAPGTSPPQDLSGQPAAPPSAPDEDGEITAGP